MANYQRNKLGRLVRHFDESKQLVSISLTPTAIAGLDALAQQYGIQGRSAFLEQLGRGLLPLKSPASSAASQHLWSRGEERHDQPSS